MKKEIENISNWIKEYFEKHNIQKAVIGLSGGIDSAVSASLCVKALGKDRVFGLWLPCYSNPEDEKDVRLLVHKLDIKWEMSNLEKTYEELIEELYFVREGLAKANIKSRLRMIVLYAFANSHNAIVVGTTNKTEMEIGYFTKYGDGGVDIEPIADFSKTEIRQIAKELEVPQSIIDKHPSAGLWEGQTDEKELGITYEQLDKELFNPQCEHSEITANLKRKAHHKLGLPPNYKRNG